MTVYGTGNTIVWDGEKNGVLARFQNGMLETENREIAEKLQKKGYRVEGLEKPAPPDQEPEKTKSPPKKPEKENA